MPDMSPKKNPMPTLDPKERGRVFAEVALGYSEEIAIAEAERCLNCKTMPCVSGCPVKIRIPEFIAKIRENDFEGAYRIISQSSALPAVCGRVCPQETQCESKCVRGIKGEPVGIGRLERFVADWHNAHSDEAAATAPKNGKRVAIVGSGPSGLTCAGDLARLGYSINTDDIDRINEAAELLKEQKPLVQAYVMDQIFDKMVGENAWIAPYYAGDYLTMYENNEDLEFYYPEEGTNLYVDAMCVPASSQNKTIAERYINFMLMKDAAVANAEYTYYASPNKEVVSDADYIDYMNDIKEDGYDKMYGIADIDGNAVNTSSYRNLTGDKLLLLNNLWEELKSDISVSGGIYAICGVILGSLAGLGIFFFVRRRKRNIY